MKRRDTIVRYTAPGRINHQITAFCFILTAVNGLGFLSPSSNWLMQIMSIPQLACILHPFVGVVIFAPLITMFFRYWHHNLTNRDNIFWAKNIYKIVVNEEVGDIGCYNSGQKCVFWAAITLLVLLLVSDVIIWRLYFASTLSIPVIRSVLMLYSFAAMVLTVVIMVHIYAALWVKGTITAMVGGWVTSAWAKKHYPRWYREVCKTTEERAE